MTKLENLIQDMTKIINLAYEKGYNDALKTDTTDTKKIKIGDKVRTLTTTDNEGNILFPIGTIGEVIYIDDDDELPYGVSANNDYFWYSRDMLTVIEREE